MKITRAGTSLVGLAFMLMLMLLGAPAQATTFTANVVGGAGGWTTATRWNPNTNYPDNDNPSPGDTWRATNTSGFPIELDADITIDEWSGFLELGRGAVPNTLTIKTSAVISGSFPDESVIFDTGSVSSYGPAGTVFWGSGVANGTGPTVTVRGALNMNLDSYLSNTTVINIASTGSLTFTAIKTIERNVGTGNTINNAGVIAGTGTIKNLSVTNSGAISPGLSAGKLTFSNTPLTNTASSSLIFELGGTTPVLDYDVLEGNSILLGGTFLDVSFMSGFENSVLNSDVFSIITSPASGISGLFGANVIANRVDTTDGEGSFLVTITSGSVTLSDFQPAPQAAATVPEPAMAGLLGLGALALIRRRRVA